MYFVLHAMHSTLDVHCIHVLAKEKRNERNKKGREEKGRNERQPHTLCTVALGMCPDQPCVL